MMPFEKRRVRVSGGELAVVDEGRGSPVVLLHGFPTSSFLWRAFVPPLSARMRVIVPDQLGAGDSDKPEDARVDVRAQAGYVRELLEGLGIQRFAVVGHDTGGAVAQLLALEGGVEAMVLIDSDAFDAWPIEGLTMLQDATPDQETPEFVAQVIDITIDLGMAKKERVTEDLLAAYRAPFAGAEDAAAFFRLARGIDGVGLAGREADLARLDVPAFLLWGEEDPYVPADLGERLAEILPDATLALLPGCSHFLQEDAPETVVPLVSEWLRTRYLGDGHGHAAGPVPLDLRRRDEA